MLSLRAPAPFRATSRPVARVQPRIASSVAVLSGAPVMEQCGRQIDYCASTNTARLDIDELKDVVDEMLMLGSLILHRRGPSGWPQQWQHALHHDAPWQQGEPSGPSC